MDCAMHEPIAAERSMLTETKDTPYVPISRPRSVGQTPAAGYRMPPAQKQHIITSIPSLATKVREQNIVAQPIGFDSSPRTSKENAGPETPFQAAAIASVLAPNCPTPSSAQLGEGLNLHADNNASNDRAAGNKHTEQSQESIEHAQSTKLDVPQCAGALKQVQTTIRTKDVLSTA